MRGVRFLTAIVATAYSETSAPAATRLEPRTIRPERGLFSWLGPRATSIPSSESETGRFATKTKPSVSAWKSLFATT